MPRVWFPVKALLGHRPARYHGYGACEYLVQWDGIDPKTGREWENTWEPIANISPAALGEYHNDLWGHEQHREQGNKEDGNEQQQERQSPQSNPSGPPKQSSEPKTPSAFKLRAPPAVPAGPSRSSEILERRPAPDTQGFSGRDGLTFDVIWGPRESILRPLCSTQVDRPPHSNIAPPPPQSQSRPKRPADTTSPALSRTQASLMKQHIQRASAGHESPAVDENPAKKRRLDMLNLRPEPPPTPGEDNETSLAGNWERDGLVTGGLVTGGPGAVSA